MKGILITESQMKFVVKALYNEQVEITKDEDLTQYISTTDPKTLKMYANKNLVSLANTVGVVLDKTTLKPKNIDAKYNDYVNEMKGYMDDSSKKVFDEMSKSNDQNILKFYYFAIAYCNNINMNWYKKKGRQISVMNSQSIKYDTVKGTPDQVLEKIEPGYVLVTDQNLDTSKFFENNEAIFTQEWMSFLNDKLKTQIETAKEQIPNSTNTGQLIELNIWTSCSRLPNNISKKTPELRNLKRPPTFTELSEARANRAKKAIVDLLKSLAISVDESKIKVSTEGDNKDGTSGPDWTRNEADRESYEKYKYCKIELKYAINTSEQTKTVTTTIPGVPDTVIPRQVNDYIITFSAIGKKRVSVNLRFKWPKINFGFLSGWLTATPQNMKCPNRP